ncbi:hypothetical protein [Levilactobacillus zymae]|uniref:hypothetical protein n=1 Tax=Levilactobacillus zymae TaxID=267363 RepID=UPI0028B4D904|nr:hypothetical protein [Levilactobacillus zymae]MDT6979459.1 hypothetical protein [Levilactobacillus zymae]
MSSKIVMQDFIKDLADHINQLSIDSAQGSLEVAKKYPVSPNDYLRYAKVELNAIKGKELSDDNVRHGINCVNHLKRAADEMMNVFLNRLGLLKLSNKRNLKFKNKTQFFVDIGVLQNYSADKLNTIRNGIEHDFSAPDIETIHLYYDIVWFVVQNLKLHLQIMARYESMEGYIYGDINIAHSKHFDLEYNSAEREFLFKTELDNKEKNGEVIFNFNDKENMYAKMFLVYWKLIEFFGDFDLESAKEDIVRISTIL